MPRRRTPTAAELARDQSIYGNADPEELDLDTRIGRELGKAFRDGVRRMSSIIDGKEGTNDNAAVQAFRAVAEVYQAKERMQRAEIATATQRTKAEQGQLDRAAVLDLLRGFTPDEIRKMLGELEDDAPAAPDTGLAAL